ncbi:MAG: MFS transporter [Candidatus Bathyarchaeia archaeon]
MASESTFRSYLIFWIGQLFSLFGSSVGHFVVVVWVAKETGSPFFVSLTALVGFAPMVAFAPFTGVIVDRTNRKTLIATVDFLQALTTVVLISLFWFSNVSIWAVLLLLVLRGTCQAFHAPAVSTLVPSMVPREKLSRMNGLNYLFSGAVNLAGPVVAAFLLVFLKIEEVLWIDPLTFIVALVTLLAATIPPIKKELKEKSSFKKDFLEGLAFIKKTRGVVPLLIMTMALNFLFTPLSTLLSYFVLFDHLGTESDLAFVMAAFQGGMLAGGILMSVRKGFKRKMVAATIFLYLAYVSYALVALTPTGWFWFMAAAGFVLLFCIPVINVSFLTIVQTAVPLEMQGRINSVLMALSSAATPLGMVLSGILASPVGTANLYLGCALAGIVVLTVAWFFTSLRHVENMAENLQKTTGQTAAA